MHTLIISNLQKVNSLNEADSLFPGNPLDLEKMLTKWNKIGFIAVRS